jgi:LysM repeat protein
MVKKGDTLWDIARQYLSNPFLWPQIHQVNTDVVRDPHWIHPGEVLRIPGATPLVAAADQTARPTVPAMERQAGPAAPTVFIDGVGGRRMVASERAASASEYPHTTVRPGEYYAAPWVDRAGGPAEQGRLIGSAELPGIAHASERARLMPHDRGYITLPRGIRAARGDRFVIVTDGANLPVGAQVMLPTGIVEVERVGEGDETTTVRLVQQFGYVEIGQRILPLERFTMPTDARPEPVEGGVESEVAAVPERAVLPSVGSYVILSATARQGIHVGDVFTLYRPRTRVVGQGTSPVTLPEEPIARAQIVKVTDRGATAMIVGQRHPAIAPGVRARLTARMP